MSSTETNLDQAEDKPLSPGQLAAVVSDPRVEFIDLGCSKGASIDQAKKIFGARHGIGIDIAPDKIAIARAEGYDVVNANILNLPQTSSVRFTTLVHFLEHLPGFDLSARMLKRACQVSSEFVFLRQPYFDGDGMLMNKGLKCYWSDWSGHRNPMTSLQLYRVLSRLQSAGLCDQFSIGFYGPIVDSDDPAILPAEAPQDQHDYDPTIHPPKVSGVAFHPPVFRELRAIVTMPGTQHKDIKKLVYWHHTLVDEKGTFREVSPKLAAR